MSKISDSTPIAQVTIGEFWELFEQRYGKQALPSQDNELRPAGRLVYGLRGIQELFNCSHKTAQYYKDNIICEAVKQNGRKIVVDADYALELFNQRRTK
jgi:hypothetical protein